MAGAVTIQRAEPQNSPVRRMKRIAGDRMLVAGIVVLGLMVLVAIFAPVIAPHDPLAQNIRESLSSPNWLAGGYSGYPLGTDQVGRDILSNVISGVRVSLMVGIGATAIAFTIGLSLGMTAGYARGWVDSLIMRGVDLLLSIPTELIALLVMALLGQGLRNLIIVIGITGWASYARTARATVLSEREREYIEAAHALGMSSKRVVLRHLLPNIMTPMAILMAVQLPSVIMLEATLSFLGLGIPVTTPSLGLTISRGFGVLFSGHWWVVLFPGIVLLLITFSINVIADSLRDLLDPRQVRSR